MSKTEHFDWIGINLQGEKISGKIAAENKKIASTQLMKNHLTILSIKKNSDLFTFNKKLSLKQCLYFLEQLQLLLQAGVPIVDSLSLIAKTTSNNAISFIAPQLRDAIINGYSLAVALRCFPEHFDKIFTQMIFAGEQSGQLDIVFTQLIENQTQRISTQNKITKALFYPVSVLIIAFCIAIGLLIFVIPQFNTIYQSFGATLPTVTRYLIAVSHLLMRQGVFYCLGIFLMILILKKLFSKNTNVKNKIAYLIFKLPIVNSIIISRQIAQWSHLLGMMLTASLPLVDALHIANHTLSYSFMQTKMNEVRSAIITGKSLHVALELCDFFPLPAKTMIAIGENADALPLMMKKIAMMYQQQWNETLDRLSKLIEPVIMMIVASIITGLIIAMYLPIFRMGSVI